MKSNPYNPGSGRPPPELAGRASVIDLVRSELERAVEGRSSRDIMLLGLRGVGKTVLLVEFEKMAEEITSHVSNVIEADNNTPLPQLLVPQLFRILIRLNRIKRAKHQAERAWNMFKSFASAFKITIGGTGIEVKNTHATGDLTLDLTDLFVDIGEAAKAGNTAVIILVDEVQCLNGNDLGALIMALHKISQRQLPILFIGAGLPQLPKLAGEIKSYAERLFHYELIGKLDRTAAIDALVEPASAGNVRYTSGALNLIIKQTQGYPYYLQEWGKHAWDIALSSPITAKHVTEASKLAIATLDNGFFASRLRRLTDRQQDYARAMAELTLPARSSEVAKVLGSKVERTAPVREEIIKKGMAYSPKRGLIDFTIPLFDEFLRRSLPKPQTTAQKRSRKRGSARQKHQRKSS